MDRPHHIYTPDGKLIVKTKTQAQNHAHNGAAGKIVRSYVHSNGHYALPVVDLMGPFDSNLMKVPSTEKLMTSTYPPMMTSELPGIDNPSFSCDEILLDSGNESDSKQPSPDVSAGSVMTSPPQPAATATPGGGVDVAREELDFVDGVTGLQADNEMSETVVDMETEETIPNTRTTTLQQEGGYPNLIGSGALSISEPIIDEDSIPPPPAFAPPPTPPALPPSLLRTGEDSVSDSGAASVRQSDIESPASSELGSVSLSK